MTAANGKSPPAQESWEAPKGERLHWYPKYPFDYHRKTTDLTLAEHGAYNLLMDAYYANRGPMRADEARLCRRLNLGTDPDPTELEALRFVVRTFFTEKDGYLYHERMDMELAKAKSIVAKRRKFGRLGGQRRSAKIREKHAQQDADS